jgi:hypothetical protein
MILVVLWDGRLARSWNFQGWGGQDAHPTRKISRLCNALPAQSPSYTRISTITYIGRLSWLNG